MNFNSAFRARRFGSLVLFLIAFVPQVADADKSDGQNDSQNRSAELCFEKNQCAHEGWPVNIKGGLSVAALFRSIGLGVWTLGGIWGLLVCIGIVYTKLGVLGVIAGLLVFPATIYLAPWYAGLVDGNWHPFLVAYGSGAVAMALLAISGMLDKD